MNSIGWVGGWGEGDVSVGVVSTSSCWQPAHPPSLLLNVKARAERAALHLCGGLEQEPVLPAAGWRGKALVLRGAARASQGLGAPGLPADCDGQWTAGAGANNSHAGSPQASRGNRFSLKLS